MGGTADGYVELWFYPSPRSVVPSCADERPAGLECRAEDVVAELVVVDAPGRV